VAYIDIDAHHGDGVMYGFYDDGRVLDIDFHQDGRTLFPGTGAVEETGRGDGAGLKVNVPLPPGTGDEALIGLFARIVPPLLEEFRPELILLQTGVDGHAGDPLARLQYTPRGYVAAISRVHRLAHALAAGRLVEVGGGGYDAGHVARVLARAAGILAGTPVPEREEDALPEPWRTEFRRDMGYEAPERWDDLPPPIRTDRTNRLDRIARELEAALGRRLGSPAATDSS
jgi:acetoin utilization protein AcuC